MKYLLAFLLLPFMGSAQSDTLLSIFSVKDGAVSYERIVAVEGASKEELFKRAKGWALANLRSQKDALQTEDKELGIQAYNSFFAVPMEPAKAGFQTLYFDMHYWNTLRIDFKEGRARIIMDNFQIASSTAPEMRAGLVATIKQYDGVKKSKLMNKSINATAANFRLADARIRATIADLAAALQKPVKEDW